MAVIPITQVARGIYRIGPLDTGRPSASTGPYVVIDSGRAAVLEPGEDGQVPELVEAIEILGVDLNNVDYVIPTHIHFHHMQGVPALLPKLPMAKFVVHPRGAPHVIEPTRLIQSTIEVWGDKCYGPFQPVPKERVMTVEDNQVLPLGKRGLQMVHTPGHAPHHMGIFDTLTRALWFGDMVVLPPGSERGHHDIRPPFFDVDKFVESLHRYQALNPSVILAFTEFGQSFAPADTLRWAEEDIRAVERICLEGLRNKTSFKEIVQKVDEYGESIGSRPLQAGGAAVQEREARRARAGSSVGGPEFGSGGLGGLLAFLKRKYPDLELPKDFHAKMLVGGG